MIDSRSIETPALPTLQGSSECDYVNVVHIDYRNIPLYSVLLSIRSCPPLAHKPDLSVDSLTDTCHGSVASSS